MNRKKELLKLAKKSLTRYVASADAGIAWLSLEWELWVNHDPLEKEVHCLYFCLLAAQLENP